LFIRMVPSQYVLWTLCLGVLLWIFAFFFFARKA
jgi:hypothetical protein